MDKTPKSPLETKKELFNEIYSSLYKKYEFDAFTEKFIRKSIESISLDKKEQAKNLLSSLAKTNAKFREKPIDQIIEDIVDYIELDKMSKDDAVKPTEPTEPQNPVTPDPIIVNTPKAPTIPKIVIPKNSDIDSKKTVSSVKLTNTSGSTINTISTNTGNKGKTTFNSLSQLGTIMTGPNTPDSNKGNQGNQRPNSKPFIQRQGITFKDGKIEKIEGYDADKTLEILEKFSSASKDNESQDEEKISAEDKKKLKEIAKKFHENPEDGLGRNKALTEKYADEFKHELLMLYKGKISTENLRNKIAEAEFKKEKLDPEDEIAKMLLLNEEGEKEKIEKIVEKLEANSKKIDLFAEELAKGTVFANEADKKFYEDNKESIDAKVPQIKVEKLKQAKIDLIDKIVASNPATPLVLTPEEIALEKDHKTEIDEAVLKRLKEDLVKYEATGTDYDLVRDIKLKIESRIRTSTKAREAYKPLSEQLQRVLSTEKYKQLSAKAPTSLSPEEKNLLDAYNAEISDIKNKLDNLGPSGKHFASLETERARLAQTSQEFQKTFVRKFPGAKILGVIGGMFGAKWSAMKEGEKTKDAKQKMDSAQASYDEVRRNLMNHLVNEEYDVRNAYGQTTEKIKSDASLKTFLENVHEEFVNGEYKKLADMKHVLEGTVRGSAMRKWGEWNSQGGWFKNVKNETARRLLHRASMAIVLGVPLSLGAGAAIGAIAGTGMGLAGWGASAIGIRALRGVIGGTVGESCAAMFARFHGGKLIEIKDANGKVIERVLEKHYNEREATMKVSKEAFTTSIFEGRAVEERPQITPSIMDTINREQRDAINKYMSKQGVTRRGEMWTRIIAGGATSYALANHVPYFMNPVSPKIEDLPIGKGDGSGVGEVSNLHDSFVDADSKGFIKTFMTLKEQMIQDQMKQPGFEGLSHDQILDKMLATGKLNQITHDMMVADSTKDFMNFSDKNGFWLPKGWNHPSIDSGSVPAGSKIGIVNTFDEGHTMNLVLKLPDGKVIPMKDGFNQALAEHLKGVKMIDSDHLGNRVSSNSNITNPGGATVQELKPDLSGAPEKLIVVDEPAPDTSLDASDYPPGQAPGDIITTPEKIVSSGGQDLTHITEAPAPATGATLEDLKSMYDLKIENINQNLAQLKKIVNPGTQAEYYKKLGYEWKGSMDNYPIKGNTDTITEVYEKQGLMHYYAPGHKNLAIDANGDLKENWKPLAESNIYKTYNALHHNYEVATNKINLLENQKHILENEHINELHKQAMAEAYPDQAEADVDTHGSSAGEGSEVLSINKLDEAGDVKFESWIDKAFHQNHLFRKDTNGLDTKAWNNLKNENANDFMSGKHGNDEVYNYSVREKRLFNILNNAQDNAVDSGYGAREVAPLPNETVEQFADRMADISAKIDTVSKNVATGNR